VSGIPWCVMKRQITLANKLGIHEDGLKAPPSFMMQ